ncbi:FecR family protein [soil metagenome]
MTDDKHDPRDAAIAWHIAMPSMGEERWLAFTAWLEADPANGAAYDAVARVDRQLAQVSDKWSSDREIASRPTARLARRAWIGIACAASLAALLVVGVMRTGQQDARYSVDTPAGTSRTIAMNDGSTVALNGATRITFDRDNPRAARLEQGEALFSVRHDADTPFTVAVGRFRVEDMGTVFNIVRDGRRLSVSVAEGRVLFDPDGARLTLGAGEAVTVDESLNMVTRNKATKVGGWQHDDLDFADAPLADVAAAIHRLTGAQIVIADPLSRAQFTGNIRVSGTASADARHLANLVGADLQRDGEKWVLSSPRDAR